MEKITSLNHTITVPRTTDIGVWNIFVGRELKTCGLHKVENLTLDFSNINFITPSNLVVLACLIEMYHEKSQPQILFIGGQPSLNNHLDNIKFKEYWNEGFERNRFTSSRNSTTLCPWHISRTMIDSYSNYAKKYFNGLFPTKDLVPLSSNMVEIFNNIFDHSQSPINGYIISQFYPKDKTINFSVCDLGLGIASRIQKSGIDNMHLLEDCQAIAKALEHGFSIKSIPQNRGFGLHNVLDFTESSNGILQIISNHGYYRKVANRAPEARNLPFNFSGTLINIVIDIESIEDKDNEEEYFEP